MRATAILVTILAWALTGASVAAVERAAEPILRREPETAYSLSGPVRRYVDAVIANWLLRAPRNNPAILEMFADRDRQPYRDLLPWSGEFAGKYFTGCTQVARLTGDDELERACALFVGKLIAQQDDVGYLGPFPREYRLVGKAPNALGGATWDAWGHYHAMLGLLMWYDDTNDEESLAAARRIGDLLCVTFLDTGRPVSSMGSSEMNQAVAHSLALLYERTGEQRYLKLAENVVDDFAAPGAGDYLRLGAQNVKFFQLPKPRWESLHPIMALAELYWITGNDQYRKAFENIWWSIAEYDRHNNGGFSSGEQAQGNPYHPGAIETCCTIAWMAMSVEMLRLTGDPRVADELELSTLNQILGLHSPDGKWSTYNTPMDGRRVPSTVDIGFQIRPGSEQLNCCSVNAARGLGMISDWALMHDEEGLVLNWFGPGTIETNVDDVRTTLTQDTDYPVNGHIAIRIEPEHPVKFALKVRVPHWSSHSRLAINDEPHPVQPGTYAVITREWQRGDRVDIDLNMSPRFWVGERECAGLASVYRGPVLLAYEQPSTSSLQYDQKWQAHADLRFTAQKGARVVFTFDGDAVEWHGARFDDAGKARVVIDDGEAEVVDQFGSQRGAPFVWKRDGLGPGRHTLRIEVLGEKSPDSANSFVNFYTFQTPTSLPTLDGRQLAQHFAVQPNESGILAVDVADVAGNTVRLRDFGGAGQNGVLYNTWLPIRGVAPAEFSKANPSRTSRAAD